MRRTMFSVLVVATVVSACTEQPVRKTSAVIVNIAPGFSPRWDTDKVQITAKSPDGLMAVEEVWAKRLRCHIGDTVAASAQGLTLTLDARACS